MKSEKTEQRMTPQMVDDSWRTMDWNNELWDLWLKKETLKALLRIAQTLELMDTHGIYAFDKP